MTAISRGYVTTPAGQVHYRTVGNPADAPTWILLHHSASSSISFCPLMAELDGRARTIAIDTPGFGMSDGLSGEVTVARLAERIGEAIEVLAPGDIGVFGHHTGAAIAGRIAAERPSTVCRLVLSGYPYLTAADRLRLAVLTRPLGLADDGGHLIDAWRRCRGYSAATDLDYANRETILLLQADRPELTYQAVLDHDTVADLTRITCPTLVIAGEDDALAASAADVAALLADPSVAIVPGAGLLLPENRPDVVAAAMLGLRRADQRSQEN